jgi:chromosome segregation ATPase
LEPTDLTIEILRSIRDEVRGVREEVHAVRGELHATRDELREEVHAVRVEMREEVHALREELGQTNTRLDRLERRQSEAEVRVATQLVAVVGAVNEVRDVLREELGLRRRVDDHERRLSAIEAERG